MAYFRKLSLTVATLLAVLGAVRAEAADPPADICSLLPPAEVSKTLEKSYEAPQKSVAPRPFANTAAGTDCTYHSKNGANLLFRVYVDPSPAAAAELFAKLAKFFGAPSPVAGLGDEAYFDESHALHVRKGKVRYYLNLDTPDNSTPAVTKQVIYLARAVAGRV